MVGDGAMQMGGMAEMLTAAKYYQSWADPRLVVLVLNNEDLNQVTWEQRVMEGDPQVQGLAGDPVRDLRRLGGHDRTEGHQGRANPAQIEDALAGGLRRGPAGDHRRDDRPGRAADTAAHQLRAGGER